MLARVIIALRQWHLGHIASSAFLGGIGVVVATGLIALDRSNRRFETLRQPPANYAMRYIQNAGGVGGYAEGDDCLVDFAEGQFVEIGVLGKETIMRYTPTRPQDYQCPAGALVEVEPHDLEEFRQAMAAKRAFRAEGEALTRQSQQR